MSKTIIFFDPNLNERGTSVSVYDYAHYNEVILGNKSIIASYKNANKTSYNKFKDRFGNIHLVENFSEMNSICEQEKAYGVHILKYGHKDHQIVTTAKNLVHVVFPSYEPHGDVYAYISEWLANQSNPGSPFVPHMIDLPEVNDNYKEHLKIHDKFIVGWYGGDNFEIPYARQAVINAAKKRSDIMFMFMNQQSFCDLPNVLFFDATTDLHSKVAFINTCDVMIHARERGETFGLAIAEFSSKNKPIITCYNAPERNHIHTLKEKGIYYKDYDSLYNILINIQHKDIKGDWNCYKEFTPKTVMEKFNQVFLQ
jgi:hypothetical protein